MSSREVSVDHKESHKHVEGYKPTAHGHGVDKSMVAQGDHAGHSGPKGNKSVSKNMADDETTALDDERGSN